VLLPPTRASHARSSGSHEGRGDGRRRRRPRWLESRRDHLLAELIGWVRIRSVAGPAEHAIELRRSAQWLAGTLREVGFPTVEV
jgi:hypothetical protein